ncbi:hypothetical protein BJX99DRAFT_271878 [Aspergillus californicus]
MTTYVFYRLDSAINNFFNNTTVTRQQCDEFAISRAGGVSTALQMQGFRDENSTIDMDNISLAKAVHPEFVASCKYLGTIGDSQPLHIYEMENLPGPALIMARIPPNDMSRQRNTINDYARFFAQSWNSNLEACSDKTATLLSEFQSKFDLLARNLPSRFASNLVRVRKELPSLFSKALPFVLSHGDLNMMNLLINPETGNITGIVDWAESGILPFGFVLYGLENLLGWMDSEGWHYYDCYRELADADLYLIRTARMAGFFCHYGFIFDMKGEVQSVRMEGSLAYLDTFCTTVEWAPLSV